MLCTKARCRRPCKIDFTEGCFLERNRKGLRWSMYFAGEGHDRAAISPAAQVATGSLLFTALEMTVHGTAHPFAKFPGPISYAVLIAFGILQIPVLVSCGPACFELKASPRLQLLCTAVARKRRGNSGKQK